MEYYHDTSNKLPYIPDDKIDDVIKKIKDAGKVITLPPPHSAGQMEMILWEGSGAAFCGRRWGKCLYGNVMIWMADGTTKRLDTIVPGDRVLSINMDTYAMEEKSVVALVDNGVKECITVSTRHHETTITPNHPVLTGLDWTMAGELREGDLVGLAGRGAFGDEEIPDYEIDLLAIWLAEGSKSCISNGDDEIIDIYRKALHELDPTLALNHHRSVNWNVVCGKYGRGIEVVSEFRKFIASYDLWDKNSHTKFIPPIIFGLSKRQISRFLNLFFSCDGCISVVSKTNGYKTFRLELGLANERMVREIAFLLSKFGIRGAMKHKVHRKKGKDGEFFESWDFRTADRRSTSIFCEEIGMISKMGRVAEAAEQAQDVITGKTTWLPISYDDFLEAMQYEPVERTEMRGSRLCIDPHMPRDLQTNLNSWRKQSRGRTTEYRYDLVREHSDGRFDKLLDGDVIWDIITSITPAGSRRTWDLSIEGNHNFIADGFVVHNTHAGVQRLLRASSQRPGLYWWVGLSWKSASMKRAWRELKFWCSLAIKEAGFKPDSLINNSNFEIRLPNGAEIWLRTAERPESLAGEGIMGAVVDEFTLMPEVIWTEYLQGTLLDYEGWAMFIGVPKNELWALNLWRKAIAGDFGPRWKGWTFTSYDNPSINKYLLDEMRVTVPDLIFRQEYLAQIVSESGGVFRGVRDAATAVPQTEAIPGHIYTMGVDFARVHDYTVYAVLDVTLGECVAMDRFQGVEYAIQVDRFMTIYNKFKPAIVYAESNSMGGPVIEQLNKKLTPVGGTFLSEREHWDGATNGIIVPFVTNAASKDTLIRAWAIAIETGQVKLPNDEVVIGEHQVYEMTQTASGGWRYSAPGGCFLPGTLITMANGCVLPIEMVKYNNAVISHTGKERAVESIMKNPYKGVIKSIKASGIPDPILATPNHPFWAKERTSKHLQRRSARKEYPSDWITADNLKKGDWLSIPKRLNLPSVPLTDDQLWVMGFWLAEGNINYGWERSLRGLTFTTPEKEYVDRVIRVLSDWFPMDTIIVGNQHGTRDKDIPSKSSVYEKDNGTDTNVYIVDFHSREASTFFLENLNEYAATKRLSDSFFSQSGLLPMLSGWIDGDGHQRKDQQRDVTVTTVSESLAWQMRQILIDNHIWCTLSRSPIKVGTPLKFVGRIAQTNYVPWIINIKASFLHLLYPCKVEVVDRRFLRHVQEDSEYFYTPIRSIDDEDYDGDVYNFATEGDNSYCAGGVAVHNSGSHDDTVIAHALAWAAKGQNKPPTLAEDMVLGSFTKAAPGLR